MKLKSLYRKKKEKKERERDNKKKVMMTSHKQRIFKEKNHIRNKCLDAETI